MSSNGQYMFAVRNKAHTERSRIPWSADGRLTDARTMFGPYIDVLTDSDFALKKDRLAHQRMMRDCKILSSIRLRQMSTASRKLQFSPTNGSMQADRAAAFCRDMWDRVRRPTEVLLNILDAIPYGASFQEITWVPDVKRFVHFSKDITPVNKDRFVFSLDGELCLRTPHDVVYGEKLPPRSFIHHRFDPEPPSFDLTSDESQLYFGRGVLDRLYPTFLWKILTLRLGFAYLDRLAFPIKVGRYPQNNQELKADLESLLQDMDHHRTVVFPGGEGWDINLVQTPATGHNVSHDWIQYFDTAFAQVILGTTMMQETGDRGSYALGAVHNKSVFGAITEADSESLCDVVQNTWATWILELNGVPGELAPKVSQEAGRSQDVAQTVDTMLLLSDRGFPISVEQISDATGIRPAKEGETLITADMTKGITDIIQGLGGPDVPGLSRGEAPSDQQKGKTITGGLGQRPTLQSLDKDRGITQKGAGPLPVYLLPEEEMSEDDIEKHARTRTSDLFSVPTRKQISGRVGPRKELWISRYASSSRMIHFDYVNLEGEDKSYEVEPYSYRYRNGRVYLFAYDPKDRHIKSFFAHKLRNIQGGRAFTPRWDVEIAA